MATVVETRADATPSGEPVHFLNCSSGFLSWALTLDHKRIGLMYLVAVTASMLLGGVFALLVRAELLTPGKTLMEHDTYNHMFTLHGAVMVFLFIIPSVPAALGNFVLPIMLGAKDVAFRASIWGASICGWLARSCLCSRS